MMTADMMGKVGINWRILVTVSQRSEEVTSLETHTRTSTPEKLLLVLLRPHFESHWPRFWALVNKIHTYFT